MGRQLAGGHRGGVPNWSVGPRTAGSVEFVPAAEALMLRLKPGMLHREGKGTVLPTETSETT